MARKNKGIQPIFDIEGEQPKEESEKKLEAGNQEEMTTIPETEQPKPTAEEQEKTHPQVEEPTDDEPTTTPIINDKKHYIKYKKEPKYKTHVSLNVRIPRELRKELEAIGRKLGVPINKNSGFFQDFTTDALWLYVKKVKKDLGLD